MTDEGPIRFVRKVQLVALYNTVDAHQRECSLINKDIEAVEQDGYEFTRSNGQFMVFEKTAKA